MRSSYAFAISMFLAVAAVAALLAGLIAPGLAVADNTAPPVSHQQLISYVIQRGLSQRGVAYLYGGGNAAGPTAGPTSGPTSGPTAGPTRATGLATGLTAPGFDASGLMQYAFAGVGIKLPRTSAQQYNTGRKIAPAEALPGDLIFFGPGGTQSVAMYLGNGQMLEATDPAVTVSAVRTANMAPYLSRIIEW